MLNRMWAIRIVTRLSGKNGGPPNETKSVSSEAPMTISGVAIGRKISEFGEALAPELVAHEREGHQRAEHRGDERRDERR